MRIRFLRDYRGAATGEVFYQAGEEADIGQGAAIIAEGAAEPAPEPVAAPEPEPEPEKPAVKRGK